VQRFLDWYGPHAAQATDPAWARAVLPGGAPLTPDLIAALSADLEAKRAFKGEAVGLDFDPFLNTQDPCERYSANASRVASDTVFVPVTAQCGPTAQTHRIATMVLVQRGARWLIADVRYPTGRSLVAMLRDEASPKPEADTRLVTCTPKLELEGRLEH
jgi:hypothetical protein